MSLIPEPHNLPPSSLHPSQSVNQPSRFKFAKFLSFLIKYWFLIGLVLAILFAYLDPNIAKKGGAIKSEYTITYGVVILIFIVSGLSLKSSVLKNALLQVKIHSLIQFISLAIAPVCGFVASKILSALGFNQILADGIIIALCTPTTISSNVLMTKQAGGSESIALINAVLGNILGVFISPLIIVWLLGTSSYGTVSYSSVFLSLLFTVIIPVIFGQFIRYIFPIHVDKIIKKIPLAHINSFLLLLLVWGVMSDTFSTDSFSKITPLSLLAIALLVIFLFLLLVVITFLLSNYFVKNERADTIAAVYCASTKTVALGIPMINVIFSGNVNVGVLAIPLLLYHALQLFFGQLLVLVFDVWLKNMIPANEDVQVNLEVVNLVETDVQLREERL